MPLVDTGLIVRYYIDEAASGQGPADVLDGSGVGADFDLPIIYDGANLNYVETSGNRGLESIDETGVYLVKGAIDDGSDKVRDNLDGAQKMTLEIVERIDTLNSSGSRIFGITVGAANGELMFRSVDSAQLALYWDDIQRVKWNLSPDSGVRRVYHIVVDTTQTTEADRVKVYKDGSLISTTLNIAPSLNSTLGIAASAIIAMLNRESLNRGLDGVMFYAALYSSAFPQGDVTTNFDILTADDDSPVTEIPAARPAWNYRLHR